MADDPWRPRLVPFFVWIVFLLPGGILAEQLPYAQPVLYSLQIVLLIALMVRYRKLTPELNLAFHWTVIPSAILLLVAWVALGKLMVASGLPVFSNTLEGNHTLQDVRQTHGEPLFWTSMILRLIGMALIVPFLEELFIRSAMLRGLHRFKPTRTGLLQFACDLPAIGEVFSKTKAGRAAELAPPALTRQLVQTPIGSVTVFAIAASTLVFMLSHAPRDWPGCIACGIVWCLMVWYTNRGTPTERSTFMPPQSAYPPAVQNVMEGSRPRPAGLGPVIWSHALVNALLWAYTLQTDDWQFL